MACPKGWEALTPLAAQDRATTPLLRNTKTGKLEATDWDHALQVFTLKFKALLDQHGPESVAWLGTGQITTEELAFLGALGKFGMGLRHGDGNTRQCMATSVAAYKQSFGFDAPPYTYADFEQSDVLVFVGSNLCVAHPILWQRVLRNRKTPEIIVIDPRRTETAMAATQHLAILPKSDLVLLYGTAQALIQRGAVKKDFLQANTSGFADFATFVKQFTPELTCQATGLSAEAFERFVSSIANGKAVSFWWTMGVNQGHEATRTAQAIINLALMTGNIGRPGTGANSITGQCNAMGSRLFSNTTNLLGGHDFATRPISSEDTISPMRRIAKKSRQRSEYRWTKYPRRIHWLTIKFSTRSKREKSKVSGSSAPTRRTHGSASASWTGFSPSSSFSWCKTCTPRLKQRGWLILFYPQPPGEKRRALSSIANGGSVC
jgi:assimilatory nitrate reductase catalytic subunit